MTQQNDSFMIFDLDSEFPVDNKDMSTVITLLEMCNERRLKFLINHALTDSRLKLKLKHYLKKCHTGTKDTFAVEYTYSKYAINNSGRLFARNGAGLQFFPRDVRAFLAGEYYWDLDQVNSHPTILSAMHKQFKVDNPKLSEYVQTRKDVLMRERLTKKAVLSMLYDGTKSPENAFAKDIHRNLYKLLVPELQAGDTYWSKLWDHLKRSTAAKIKSNPEGRFVALVMQTLENQALDAMVTFFKNKQFSPEVLVFDGLMVRRDSLKTIDDNLLTECQQYIYEKTNLDIAVALKPMEVSKSFADKFNPKRKREGPDD
ncbi:hypothetical protein HK104_007954, partial [Borealophlyctis nickersoniae]